MGRGDIVEQGKRSGHPARFVGIGKMRHQRDVAHGAMAAQSFDGLRHLLRRNTKAVHAAVHLEPDVECSFSPWRVSRIRIQQGDLLRAVNYAGQIISGDDRQVFRAEKSFQQQDGLAETRLAQLYCVPDIQQRETVCRSQRFSRAQQPMPVAVRLDDGHDA